MVHDKRDKEPFGSTTSPLMPHSAVTRSAIAREATFDPPSVGPTEVMMRHEVGASGDHDMTAPRRYSAAGAEAHTDSELLSGDGKVISSAGGRHRQTEHRSSLLNDTAREALIGPYRNQTAVLLTVASSGALIFLVINLVGVLLCKGYFRKRAPSCRSSSLYLHSLSQSRRSRYSTLLRRFSLESYAYSCCEHGQQQPAPAVVVTRRSGWLQLSTGLVTAEDELSAPIEGTTGSAPLAGAAGPNERVDVNKDEAQLRALLSELGEVKCNKAKSKQSNRARSFDDGLLLGTSRRLAMKGSRLAQLVQLSQLTSR